jgi:hypothetical protein
VPKETRRRRNAPARGEWRPTEGAGWQHGPIPDPPDGLVAASRNAWTAWFSAWFAANWTPADLPGLHVVVAQYDAIQRGGVKANDVTALLRGMDTYGITPAGQQSRRWVQPKAEEPPRPEAAPGGRYGHLRAVSE